jgi:hypothetical protein
LTRHLAIDGFPKCHSWPDAQSRNDHVKHILGINLSQER